MVVATKGRDTLARTLAAVAPQLESGDELLVMRLDCEWGNEARDLMMAKATGTHLLFIDDDDVHTPDALTVIREAVSLAPTVMHIFRMAHGDGLTWAQEDFAVGNVGTPMVCFPNLPDKASWQNKDGPISDFRFIHETLKIVGGPPRWYENVVAELRP